MNIDAASLPTTGRPLAGWTCAAGGLIGAAGGLVTAGWAGWTPLLLGILVFVMVVPGIRGTFVEGRLAITMRMLVWTGLGVALIRDRDGSVAVEVF